MCAVAACGGVLGFVIWNPFVPVTAPLERQIGMVQEQAGQPVFQIRTRGGVNCPRCDLGGEGGSTGVDFESLERVEALRDSEQQTARILEVLNLEPGQVIADVGAGSGYFSYIFSESVGASGQVWAVDIADSAIGYLLERIQTRPPPHPNIRVVHS
ncbi:MAG: SAM-dependent methyltransferase, partial [Myxococcota bacterium]|nr:SAM-dependent methyltransferase [Myxococcota bacterium]